MRGFGKEGLFTLMRVQITGRIQERTVILSGGVCCDFLPLQNAVIVAQH